MFIEVDLNKRPQKAKFQLAKPNMQIISAVNEYFNGSMSIKLGSINELNFSIPYYVDDENFQQIKNTHIDLIKEKMLIKVVFGTYKEWYTVEEIEESGDDSDTFNVKAFSLPYELSTKKVGELEEQSINATELLNKLLDDTVWSIGEVDSLFNSMYRSFESGDDPNVLDSITKAAETYGALIVWDTLRRKVSFKNMYENGRFRGMTVNYGKFLQSIRRSRTADEMTTILTPVGNEGLTIHNVNPSGQGYIEDYSYFMYPFEMDENENVLKSSYYMSDDLCKAIIKQKKLSDEKYPQIKSLLSTKMTKETSLVIEETKLVALEGELKTLKGLLDIAKATGDKPLAQQRRTEVNNKTAEITAQKEIIKTIKDEILSYENQINTLQNEITDGSGFTGELLSELKLYKHEKRWVDDRYIDEQELYDDALKRFEELRQPKIVIEISIDNLMDVIEEQYYWDKLVLGDLIKVKYPQMNIEYTAKIIEINYDLENREATITVANTKDLLSETDKLVQLLYGSSNASTLIQNNKYKWDKVSNVEADVISLLTDEWDTAKQRIIAGVQNSIEISDRGIIVSDPSNPNNVIVIQSGIIALSKNAAEDWQTAVTADGVIAERLLGQIIAGQNLLITNESGTFLFNKDGVEIDVSAFILKSSEGTNVIDDINESVNDLSNRLNEAELSVTPDQIMLAVKSHATYVQDLDDIRKEIDDIEIGQRNLIRNSTFNQYNKNGIIYNWTNSGDFKLKEHRDSDKPKSNIITINKTGNTANMNYALWSDPIEVAVNGSQKMTLSFDMKVVNINNVEANSELFIIRTFDDSSKTNDSDAVWTKSIVKEDIESAQQTGKWIRHRITITPSGGKYVKVAPSLTRNGEVHWREIKLEYGSKATGWSQAVEDIEEFQYFIESRVSSAEQIINSDSIVTRVIDSVSFANEMNTKADAQTLTTNYMNNDELNSKLEELKNYTDGKVDSIDLSSFVTSADVETTSKDVVMDFVQAGGVNLLRNSTGFKNFDFWTISNTSGMGVISNTEIEELGFSKGFNFSPTVENVDQWMEQSVYVSAGKSYTLSCRVNKRDASTLAGELVIEYDDGSGYINLKTYTTNEKTNDYDEMSTTFIPTSTRVKIRVYAYRNCDATVAGLMLNRGEKALQWTMANGEVYNTTVQFDLDGIKVNQVENGEVVGYTEITPTSFAGYYDTDNNGTPEKIFWLEKDETVSKKFRASDEITMDTIKIVKVNTSTKKGWAFVPID